MFPGTLLRVTASCLFAAEGEENVECSRRKPLVFSFVDEDFELLPLTVSNLLLCSPSFTP